MFFKILETYMIDSIIYTKFATTLFLVYNVKESVRKYLLFNIL